MDAETSRWAAGLAFAAIVGLIVIIFRWLQSEDKRLAKNIHELRNTVQALAIQVASLMKRRQ